MTVFYRYNSMYDGENEPFVMIFEIRNSEGVTEHLAWQSGIASGSITSRHIGFLWAPERAGEYELRAFAITGFENQEVLTYV